MKTILIPTDFSEDAKHACKYGAALAKDMKAEKIILYNAYSLPIASEMTWALMESDTLKRASYEGVNAEKRLMATYTDPSIEIEAISEFGFMAEQIDQLAKDKNVDLVIMGIADSNKLEQALIGSNALTIIHNTNIPVLVVPPNAEWQHVDQIAWACDYKEIEKTAPIDAIKDVLRQTGAKLHVVHNETNHKNYDPELVKEDVFVHDVFKTEAPEYALLEGEDMAKNIDGYVKKSRYSMAYFNPERAWLVGELICKEPYKATCISYPYTHVVS